MENPSYPNREKIWKTYAKVLERVARCDSVSRYSEGDSSQLIQVIQQFEPG